MRCPTDKDGPAALELQLTGSIADIAAEDWDACANPDPERFDPFLSHAFLHALEASGSASAEEGWAPMHLVYAAPEDGTIRAVMPLYLKGHSYGEFVFDHAWANAYHRAGGQYYPKLQSAVPFTPVTGRRLLVRPGPDEALHRKALAGGAVAAARKLGVSSVHVTFPTEDDWSFLGDQGFLQRQDQQFWWQNRDYDNFDGFLNDLASRKRKNLRKEREAALSNGVTIRWLTGKDLTEEAWDAFFAFYRDTGARKWGTPYLTRSFFSRVGEAMADQILLVMCYRDGTPIAGALNFIGGDALYGRHWGCIEDHRFLHFEACYYQAIDFAISRGLSRVEAGAQGAHKIARGYVPKATYSAHWIADPGFRDAIARYLESERAAVAEDMAALEDIGPYKKDTSRFPEEESGDDEPDDR
ncbi:MAG: GNAT family N-acetyltransferase [Alphaproteobacteria bacterium]